MKILFITRGFPSEKDPMDGNYEAVQAKAIAKKGHEVSVIAIHWQNLLHVFGNHQVRHRVVNGIHVYEANKIKLSIPYLYFPKVEEWARQFQFRRVFRKYVKKMGMPDVVHAHIVQYAAPAVILKTEYHLPFVITEHWSHMFRENTLKRVMNQTYAYRYADRIICVSEALKKSLESKCHIESMVINNMVSDQFFESRKMDRHDGSFRFIAVGGLRKDKRFDILVEAFGLCHFPASITLDIVGEGYERPLIESKIHEYRLDGQVKLLGVKTQEEVSSLLCQSDCFVLSSRLETFSIVIIEAMAKGLPVISTRCGGPETFLRAEDGVLVPTENSQELAKAMKYMTEHYQEYDAEEIRKHCQGCFSQDVIANKILSEYQKVIEQL